MSSFVNDATSLNYPKVDLIPIPAGADSTKYVQASDWNTLCQATVDLRTAVTTGNLIGFSSQAARPTLPSAATRFLWVKTDNNLYYYNGTTDTNISNAAASLSASVWYSTANFGSQQSAAAVAGNFTVGGTFQLLQPATITGCRFWYPDSTSRTIKVTVWDPSNVSQGSVSGVFNSSGIKTMTFSSPISVTAANTFKLWTIGMYDTSGGVYWKLTSASFQQPATPFLAGPNFVWYHYTNFIAGDAQPTSAGSEIYTVEPVFTVP